MKTKSNNLENFNEIGIKFHYLEKLLDEKISCPGIESMRGYFKIERLVNPCLPAPTPTLLRKCCSGSSIICLFQMLWLLAQHKIASFQ
ncbi:hypothetical protein OIU78_007041 [Salix suchowensis]|nr:hypothetical protein OIU78_007041 [Salix suchowensis]